MGSAEAPCYGGNGSRETDRGYHNLVRISKKRPFGALTGSRCRGYNPGLVRDPKSLQSTSLPPPADVRPMRILMLAPEPFFEPRGTPFSEYHRIKALVELGHHVDLVTYPFGADVDLPNLRIIRCGKPPFLRGVRIGPSAGKAVLDLYLTVTAIRQARRERYDAIHSHEEAGLLGVWLARRLKIPHLYDMHSSLPQQLTNFRFARSRLLRRAFEVMEDRTVFGSDVVITICQDLHDHVEAMGAGERSVLIENVMGGDVEEPPQLTPGAARERWEIPADAPLVLYTGTFEPYQGLDLLFDAMGRVAAERPAVRLLVVGGRPEQVEAARARAARAGAPAIFTGYQPARDIPAYVAAADLLASPRTSGTNTPLKIYSYLRAGKPIVATDLLTHRQVLDAEIALLARPEPDAFAAAIARMLDDRELRERLGRAAAARAESRYSRAAYVERTREAFARLAAAARPLPDGARA
jgi:glycosyltransferase involved in cell wall biosynthesis